MKGKGKGMGDVRVTDLCAGGVVAASCHCCDVEIGIGGVEGMQWMVWCWWLRAVDAAGLRS